MNKRNRKGHMNTPSLLNNFFGYDPIDEVNKLVDEAHTIVNGRTVAKTICPYCNNDISEMDLEDTTAHMIGCKEEMTIGAMDRA